MRWRLRREHRHGIRLDREPRRRVRDDFAIAIDRAWAAGANLELLGPDRAHLLPRPMLAIAEGARHQRELPGALELEAVEIEVLVVDRGTRLDGVAAAVI